MRSWITSLSAAANMGFKNCPEPMVQAPPLRIKLQRLLGVGLAQQRKFARGCHGPEIAPADGLLLEKYSLGLELRIFL